MAQTLRVARSGKVLKPAKTEDLKKIQKFKEGEMFLVRYERVRNPKLHRKYFALINKVFENQEFFESQERLRKFLEIAAGHYQVVYMPKFKTGEVKELIWPQSISYHKLDGDEFQNLYEKVMEKIQENFGIDPDLIESEVKYE